MTISKSMFRKVGIKPVLGFAMVLLAAPAWAHTFHVENWGVDSGTCGATGTPCRSIGAALAPATTGDTVLVGPGVYGNDLDADANYNEPGEEPSVGLSIGAGVIVKSTHGAAATRIKYTIPYVIFPVSGLVAGGQSATLGTRNHGFTIMINSSNFILTFTDWIAFPSGGSVAGNVVYVTDVSGLRSGILAGGGTVVRDNRVVDATSSSLAAGIAGGAIVERNVVIGVGSGPGFYTDALATLRRNSALENEEGFLIPAPLSEFTKNIAMANSGYGVELSVGSHVTGAFQKNTIVGNDTATNCGLYNGSGAAQPATKNFWGLGGPGADPADNVCNGAGSSTTTAPFLAHPAAPGPGALQ